MGLTILLVGSQWCEHTIDVPCVKPERMGTVGDNPASRLQAFDVAASMADDQSALGSWRALLNRG